MHIVCTCFQNKYLCLFLEQIYCPELLLLVPSAVVVHSLQTLFRLKATYKMLLVKHSVTKIVEINWKTNCRILRFTFLTVVSLVYIPVAVFFRSLGWRCSSCQDTCLKMSFWGSVSMCLSMHVYVHVFLVSSTRVL